MRPTTLLWIFTTALAVTMASAMMQVGFVTVDDSLADLEVRKGTSLWEFSWAKARESGRLDVVAFQLASFVPHLTQTNWGYQTIKLLSLLGSILAFCLMAKKVGGTWRIGFLCGVLFLTATQNTWFHNPFNAYPFVFSLSSALAIVSVVATMSYVERGRIFWLVIQALCLFLSAWIYKPLLGIHVVVIYVAWAALSIPRSDSLEPPCPIVGESVRRRRLATVVPILVALCYLLVSWVFQHRTESTFVGREDAVASSWPTVNGLTRIAAGGLPLYQWFEFIRDPASSDVIGRQVAVEGSLFQLFLASFRLEWLAKSLIAGTSVWLCIVGAPAWTSGLRTRNLLPISLLLVIVPSALICLTTNERSPFQNEALAAHVGGGWSRFGVYLFIAVLLVKVARALHGKKKAQRFFGICVAIGLGVVSFLTSVWNYQVQEDQGLVGEKWRLVDHFIDSPDFVALPKGAIIYGPSMWEGGGIFGDDDSYWTQYLTAASGGKAVTVCKERSEVLQILESNPQAKIFFLRWNQDGVGNQYLVFSRLWVSELLGDDELSIASDRVVMFCNPRRDGIEISGSVFPLDLGRRSTVTLSDRSYVQVTSDFEFLVPWERIQKPTDYPWRYEIVCDWLLAPDSVTLQSIANASDISVCEVLGFDGFYEAEFVEGESEWLRWTNKRQSKVQMKNNHPMPVQYRLRTSFRGYGNREAVIHLPGRKPIHLEFSGVDDRKFLDEVFTLEVGVSEISIESVQPPALAENGVRQLAIQCYPMVFDIVGVNTGGGAP